MKVTLARPKLLFVLLSLLLAALFLTLWLYFAGKGAFDGVFLKNEVSFSVFSGENEVLSPKKARLLSEGEHDLILKNKENEALSFLICQGEKELFQGMLAPEEEKVISVMSNGSALSVLIAGKECVAYLSDTEAFSFLSDQMPSGGDLIFLSPVSLSGTLRAPFRLFGSFSFEELSFDTEEKGNIVLDPEQDFSALLYVNAPSCRIFWDSFSLSAKKDLTEYYLTAKSVNGKALSAEEFPVDSFEGLLRLSDETMLPRLSDGAHLNIIESFAIKEDVTLPFLLRITLSAPLSFDGHTVTFSSEKEGLYQVKSALFSAPSPSEMIFLAPRADLVWESDGITAVLPSIFLLEKYSNLSRYNGKALSLGGEGQSLPVLTLYASENEFLSDDVTFSVKGNLICATLPYLVSEKDLDSASFVLSASFGQAALEGTLSDGVVVTRDEKGGERRFALCLEREALRLPVVHLYTEDGEEVTSKTQYVSASFAMDGGESSYESIPESHIRIRGRGNSSWKWEKKPFKIHFDQPTSLLGLPEAEEWALFSNYADKSLMRNRLAQVMASTLSFEYCPTQVCVDVFLNGQYQGVYTLGEHLESGAGRVEVKKDMSKTDCGYFLEAGGVVSGVDVKGMNYFHAGLVKFVLIKDPDYNRLTSEQFEFIRNYMLSADEAVKKGEGYEKYLDLDTLVDWMIMIELSCNTDCTWRRSTYFTKEPGEKLVMGPVWDFDLAFGNFSKDNAGYDTWVSTEPDDDYVGETWSTYLLEDPEFRALFKKRWQEVGKTLVDVALAEIDRGYHLISPSAEQNFKRWDILGRKVAFERHDTVNYKTYESQIYYLENFILQRASWLDGQIENW